MSTHGQNARNAFVLLLYKALLLILCITYTLVKYYEDGIIRNTQAKKMRGL